MHKSESSSPGAQRTCAWLKGQNGFFIKKSLQENAHSSTWTPNEEKHPFLYNMPQLGLDILKLNASSYIKSPLSFAVFVMDTYKEGKDDTRLKKPIYFTYSSGGLLY